jgi:hypothetical protein
MKKHSNNAIFDNLTKMTINKNSIIVLDEFRRNKKRKQFAARYLAFYGTGWAK